MRQPAVAAPEGREPSGGGKEQGPGVDWLTAEEVVVGYDRPVLGPVSFRVGPREVVGIWGPNGAGKSTLLRAVAGTARVLGGRLEREPGLRLAYQAQQPPRPPEVPLTAGELLAYRGAAEAEPPGRLAEWLDRRVDKLSGGQFQLLTVWANLAGGAELVLLDEPSNNLDPDSMDLLAGLLGGLSGELGAGRPPGVLLVSHERAFLEQLSHRVVEVGA